MQRSSFESSLDKPAPPENITKELAALWWLKNHNWQKAHDLIDGEPGTDTAWVHALLHRMEGDEANAEYWYGRSGRKRGSSTIGQEIEDILDYFLS